MNQYGLAANPAPPPARAPGPVREPVIGFPLDVDPPGQAVADLAGVDIDTGNPTAGHKIQRQQGVPLVVFPYPSQLSSHYVMVRPRVHEWFISKGILSGHRLANHLVADYTLFTAMMHPPCTRDRLERLARYYSVWFAMETHAESLWGRSGASNRWFSSALEYLDTGRADLRDPWTAAFAEAVEGLRLPPDLRLRHARWKRDWIEAEMRVAGYGNRPHPDFLHDRHHSLGNMLALNVFTPYSLSLDPPSSFQEHPVVQSLLWALTRASSWQSDLLSLEVEDSRGERVNTVNVVCEMHGLSRQEGIAEIHRLFHADTAEAQRLQRETLAQDFGLPEHLTRTYLDAVFATTAGFNCWNQISDRYKPQLYRTPPQHEDNNGLTPFRPVSSWLPHGPRGLGTSAARITLPRTGH